MATNLNELAKEINKALAEYANGVGEEIEKVAEKVAKNGVKTLRLRSPKSPGGGDYAKGWRAKKVDGVWVVHNATRYQLTHLLEKGHALVNGGRSRKFPHIGPTEDEMINEFVEGVEEAIRK